MTTPRKPIARIMARVVAIEGPLDTPCWVTDYKPNRFGYARTRDQDGTFRACHRIAYVALVGPVPDGLQLDHLCRVRACCNPAHLEPVTCRENLMRGISGSAINARKTECHKGHPFTPENTEVSRTTGKRACRTCRRESAARHREKVGPEVLRARDMASKRRVRERRERIAA